MRKLAVVCAFALMAIPAVLSAEEQEAFETYRFKVTMSPSHQSPALTGVDAVGTGTVEIILKNSDPKSAIVDFRVDYHLGQPETLVAMHIHQGDEGVGGPVVLGSVFGGPVNADAGSGTLYRSGQFTSSTDLATIQNILAYPSGYYLNVHSSSHPGGIIRGQLQPEISMESLMDQFNALTRLITRFALMHGIVLQ